MSRRHLYILAAVLTALGLLPFLYKSIVLGFPLRPDEVIERYRIEVRVVFEAQRRPVKVTMRLPQSEGEYALLGHTFLAPGYGVTTSSPDANRVAVFSRRSADGLQSLYFTGVVQRAPTTEQPAPQPVPVLRRPRMDEAERASAKALMAEVVERSADTDTLVAVLIRALRAPEPDGPAAALLGAQPTTARIAATAARVLRSDGTPARTVHGLALAPDRRDARFDHWIEVYADGKWKPYELTEGQPRAPEGRLPWWRGEVPLVRVEGGVETDTTVSVRRAFEFAVTAAIDRGRAVDSTLLEFSVFGLPLHTQAVYQILLIVPFGIFVLVVLRNIVGVTTFGTFMPVLIALAFRQTELVWGLVLFAVVLGIGLAVRAYLERLKLLLVPRLGAIVIVVILIMAVLSLLSHKLGFERGLSVALFPIVILSMTIERMSIVWDERGPATALKEAGGSLLVAVVCYLAMNITAIRHLVFVFPELLLVLLAATLLIGRYTGYRLVELPRFKAIARPGA